MYTFLYFQIDYETHFARFANMSYDAANERFRIVEYLLVGETRAHRLELFLHKEVRLFGNNDACRTVFFSYFYAHRESCTMLRFRAKEQWWVVDQSR